MQTEVKNHAIFLDSSLEKHHRVEIAPPVINQVLTNPEILEKIDQIPALSIHSNMMEVLEIFRSNFQNTFFPVVDEHLKPLGVIREEHLKTFVYAQYGRELLAHPDRKNALERFMSKCPMISIEQNTEEILKNFSSEKSLMEGILVTQNQQYVGFLHIHSLLELFHIREVEMVEENNRVLASKNSEIQQKNRDIQSILENIQQGIFTIEQENKIHPEYSQHLEQILETTEIAGRNMINLLFRDTDIGSDKKQQIEVALGSLIGEDMMMYDLNQHILVNEFSKSFPTGKEKILEVSWNPIPDQDNIIEKMMIVVRDVTDLRALQKNAEKQQQKMQKISQILSIAHEKFIGFLKGSYQFLDQNQSILDQSATANAESIGTLFQNLHTIKGNARTYGFTFVTDVVHQAEQTYEHIRKNKEEFDRTKLLQELQMVREGLEQYEEVYRSSLSEFAEDQSRVKIDRNVYEQLLEMRHQLSKGNSKTLGDWQTQIFGLLQSLDTIRLETVLMEIAKGLPTLCHDLGKVSPQIQIQDLGMRVTPEFAKILQDAFGHIARNAIDHGIEAPEERVAVGKPEVGTIYIVAKTKGDQFYLEFWDDGRGIEMEKVRSKAQELKLIESGEELSDQTLAEFIFHSGLSTTEKVTTISGRGVGMSAIQEFIEQQGGKLNIHFTGEPQQENHRRTFKLVFMLPSKYVIVMNTVA